MRKNQIIKMNQKDYFYDEYLKLYDNKYKKIFYKIIKKINSKDKNFVNQIAFKIQKSKIIPHTKYYNFHDRTNPPKTKKEFLKKLLEYSKLIKHKTKKKPILIMLQLGMNKPKRLYFSFDLNNNEIEYGLRARINDKKDLITLKNMRKQFIKTKQRIPIPYGIGFDIRKKKYYYHENYLISNRKPEEFKKLIMKIERKIGKQKFEYGKIFDKGICAKSKLFIGLINIDTKKEKTIEMIKKLSTIKELNIEPRILNKNIKSIDGKLDSIEIESDGIITIYVSKKIN